MNYRERHNRREAFLRWYAWSLTYQDCDPAVWLTNYLHRRFEHNDEQRLWLCWLYGTTYQLPTAWILMNEFPDFELATVDRIDAWNTANYTRLRYQTDTKWNKGHLPKMFASYQTFIGTGTQRARFASLQRETPGETFQHLWENVKHSLHKFGRYSTWFYLQHLKATAGLPMTPTSLMLSDYEGSRSHRNGLVMALGYDDLYDRKLTAGEYGTLERLSSDLLEDMVGRYPALTDQIDYFTMETALCAFKKLFRTNHGRYLGYYLDRQAEEIHQCAQDGWNGIAWQVFWDARTETLDTRLQSQRGVERARYGDFLRTGHVARLDWMFPDEVSSPSGLDHFFF